MPLHELRTALTLSVHLSRLFDSTLPLFQIPILFVSLSVPLLLTTRLSVFQLSSIPGLLIAL